MCSLDLFFKLQTLMFNFLLSISLRCQKEKSQTQNVQNWTSALSLQICSVGFFMSIKGRCSLPVSSHNLCFIHQEILLVLPSIYIPNSNFFPSTSTITTISMSPLYRGCISEVASSLVFLLPFSSILNRIAKMTPPFFFQNDPFLNASDYIISLLIIIFPWVRHILFPLVAFDLTYSKSQSSSEALHDLALFVLFPFSITLRPLASLLLLKHGEPCSTKRPLYELFPLPNNTPLLQLPTWLPLSLLFFLFLNSTLSPKYTLTALMNNCRVPSRLFQYPVFGLLFLFSLVLHLLTDFIAYRLSHTRM